MYPSDIPLLEFSMSKLLSINEVAKRVGVSVNAIRIRIGKGKFPAPTERKGKEMFWDESTLRGLSVSFSGTVSFDLHPTLDLYGKEEDYVKMDGVSLRSLGTSRVAQAMGRAKRDVENTKPVDFYVYGDPDGPAGIERSYHQFMRSYIHHPDYITRQQGLQVDTPDLSDPEVFRDLLKERIEKKRLVTQPELHPLSGGTRYTSRDFQMLSAATDASKSVLAPIVTKSILNQMEAEVKACSGGCADCKNKPTE
jgi:predicted DNA-binding transcriptional regulator AlpA